MTVRSEGDGRDRRGRFSAGNGFSRGNPVLRRQAELQGAVRDAINADDLREVMAQLLALAKGGDTTACKILLERCVGKPTDEPRLFALELPEINDADGIREAMRCVVSATADGSITVPDALAVVGVLRQFGDATVYAALADRVSQLEKEPDL